jgi:hypothetical protein
MSPLAAAADMRELLTCVDKARQHTTSLTAAFAAACLPTHVSQA